MSSDLSQPPCPCGSGKPFAACCGPYLAGERPAPTAESLMRSRYTAFARGDAAYLLATWHASTRPADLDLADDPVTWQRLDIRQTQAGGLDDTHGEVAFTAHYLAGGQPGVLQENSRFVRENGQWYYVDGQIGGSAPAKPGRNAPCPCGSGKKYKRCCGR